MKASSAENAVESRNSSGFTVVELVIIVVVAALLIAIAIPTVQPILQSIRLERALDVTSMELRRARQAAVDYRRIHRLRFQNGAISLEQMDLGGGWNGISEVGLPAGVQFAMPYFGSAQTPDGISGDQPVDFDGQDWVMFYPDGSARGLNGGYVNGIVFHARDDQPGEGNAVTLFGATGRVRAWRLQDTGSEMTGSKEWK